MPAALLLGLQFGEELPPRVKDELEQILAALQQYALALAQQSAARCVAYATALQSLPDNTETAVVFDTNEVDPSAMHSVGSSRFTVPTGQDGHYRLTCTGLFAANATGQRYILARKNGVTQLTGGTLGQGNPSGTYNAMALYNSEVTLVAGDYIEFLAYQNSGGALNLGSSGAQFYSTRASMTRVA